MATGRVKARTIIATATVKKTVLTENAALQVLIPRDRHGSFEPQLIAKYQRRFPGFDEKIVSMDSRGISVRDGKPIGASPRL